MLTKERVVFSFVLLTQGKKSKYAILKIIGIN